MDTVNFSVDTILNISKAQADTIEFDDMLVILATTLAALCEARDLLECVAAGPENAPSDLQPDARALLAKWSGDDGEA